MMGRAREKLSFLSASIFEAQFHFSRVCCTITPHVCFAYKLESCRKPAHPGTCRVSPQRPPHLGPHSFQSDRSGLYVRFLSDSLRSAKRHLTSLRTCLTRLAFCP